MSWFKKVKLNWTQRLCADVLKVGHMPKHVAIIMDGNRRYARMHGMDTIHGHIKGFEKIGEILQWCAEMGIKEVTVYAFSIENFKRTREEVTKLMYLAKEKFKLLLEEKDKLMESGMRIRVLGDVSRFPENLQRLIAETVLATRNNTKAIFNICLAYTGRDDMFQAVKEICEGVELDLIRPSDISEQLFASCLYSTDSPEPEILLRTSGEIRLSDFLLWQSSYSVLAFVEVLWPNMSIWNFFTAILYYQIHCEPAKRLKAKSEEYRDDLQLQSDWQCAAQEIKSALSSSSDCKHGGKIDVTIVDEYREERKIRVEVFLKHVEHKRLKLLEKMMTFSP